MNCPNDGERLMMTERSGVEIDYCPKCRGVWLDRGELDKIIDRAAPQAGDLGHDRDYRPDRRHSGHGQKPYRKKKESFLGELFDF